jgi:hypothetical protein
VQENQQRDGSAGVPGWHVQSVGPPTVEVAELAIYPAARRWAASAQPLNERGEPGQTVFEQ